MGEILLEGILLGGIQGMEEMLDEVEMFELEEKGKL